MSRLEELNIPVIGPMLDGAEAILDREQQLGLTRWALKTAMVQDAIRSNQPDDKRSVYRHPNHELFYSTSERHALRDDRGFPTYTNVWLGRSSLRTLGTDGCDIGADVGDGVKISELTNGCVNTFVVGHLAIQVLSLRVPAQYDGLRTNITAQVPAPWSGLTVQLCTSETIRWPPPLTLMGDNGILGFNNRFKAGTGL